MVDPNIGVKSLLSSSNDEANNPQLQINIVNSENQIRSCEGSHLEFIASDEGRIILARDV